MVRSNTTDGRQWEYLTYAPQGESCPACRRSIAPFEPVRRGTVERASGATVVVYRHMRCPLVSE